MTRSPSTADLTTVPDRNTEAVTDLLAGQYGTVMQEIARDAVCRAWMGGYMADGSAVLLDITEHARRAGHPLTVRTGEIG